MGDLPNDVANVGVVVGVVFSAFIVAQAAPAVQPLDALIASLNNSTRAVTNAAPKERNHTMNASLSTNLRRMGRPAFSVGLGILLIGAAIGATTLSRPSAPARQAVVRPVSISQGVPIQGAGSAYDGGHYGGFVSAPHTLLNLPISGTGSAYDGGHYSAVIPAPRASLGLAAIGTGSVYDGGHYNGR